MIITPREIAGVFLIDVEPVRDERGFFARTSCAREFEAAGLNRRWVQSSVSNNARRGTLRGLHFQRPPHAETKLVRCTSGAIFDVVVDLRRGSSTFGRWLGVELSRENRRALYIPEGCAHGFQTLADETDVAYDISTFYSPERAAGVRFDDSEIGIAWPISGGIVISQRDRELPLLRDVEPLAVADIKGAPA